MTRNRIEGYHGTTKANAMGILSQNHFRNSTKDNEWLGTGVYFFAYAGHAKWWCSHARFANCETVILQAILEYRQEQLLDLDDPSTLAKVNLFVKTALEHADELGLSLGIVEFSSFSKENTVISGTTPKRIGYLDVPMPEFTYKLVCSFN